MFTYEFILATALLTTPTAETEWHNVSIASMRAAAVEEDICDIRIIKYDPNIKYESIVEAYQQRQYLPQLEEIKRFPSREVAIINSQNNFFYKESLRRRLIIDPYHAEEIKYQIHLCEQMNAIWSAIIESHSPVYYVHVRRQSLQKLKELLGDEAFYSGDLP